MGYYKRHSARRDFLYLRLKNDISVWYEENGDSDVKALHLHLLRKYYDPARFVDDIGPERVKFLTELQEIVDLRSMYGMAEMS